MLDINAPTPLYQQLAQILESEIQAGIYRVGRKVPSEHDLAHRFQVGRPTVRQATELLVRKSLLERRRGSGTFVREAAPEVDLFSLGGTAAAFEKEGLELKTRLLASPKRVNSQSLGGKPAWRLVRLSRVADKPVVLERLDFDYEQFPDIQTYLKSARSLSQLVKERYHLSAEKAHQTFRVGHPNETEASALQVNLRKCMLFVERQLHFEGAGHVVHSRLCCLTDTIGFCQEVNTNE